MYNSASHVLSYLAASEEGDGLEVHTAWPGLSFFSSSCFVPGWTVGNTLVPFGMGWWGQDSAGFAAWPPVGWSWSRKSSLLASLAVEYTIQQLPM